MTIHVKCPGCSAKFQAPEDLAGKRVKCPKCGRPLTVGAPQPAFRLGQATAPGSRQGILSVILAFQAILIAVVGAFSIHWLSSTSVANKNSPDPRFLLALVLLVVVPVVVTGLAVAGLILGIMGRRAGLRQRGRVPVAVTLGMFLNLLTLLHPLWLCVSWGWGFTKWLENHTPVL